MGLKLVPDTNCLYMNEWLILIFYVDDIGILYDHSQQEKMDEFERKLTDRYELRSLGEMQHFLGIRILRNSPERKLWLV